MKILFVYPEFLVTFWSWKDILKFVRKKAAFPPLGLLTVAAMLPKWWGKRLVDINVGQLTDEDIRWADFVFISAMITQRKSTKEVISRCKKIGVPVVLGGPILEVGCEKFPEVDHFLVGEVENTIQEFVEDLKNLREKKMEKKEYPAKNFPDLSSTPIPLWGLINPRDYACMLVQYGRGCPFKCGFCNVGAINGRVPRAKSLEQFLKELDALCQTGFRGAIMFADDNLIGNKGNAKEMIRGLCKWQQAHGYPFEFTVEADITLSEDKEMMDLMVQANFKKVFLGLETPNRASLIECGKVQNANRDMQACVKVIQNHGLIPMSGFIVGFDNDDPDTFDTEMVNFIQGTGIVIAMVGVLQAPPGSSLLLRLKAEGRFQSQATGNNTDCYPNFAPKMPVENLVKGYRKIVKTIYSPKKYYERICVFLREYNNEKRLEKKATAADFKAFLASIWQIGLLGGPTTSYYYWKTLALVFLKYQKAFPEAVAFWIYGFHFQGISKGIQES